MFPNRRFLFNCKNMCTRRYLWICISVWVYSRQETSVQNYVRCVTSSLCHRSILTINCFYGKQYYKEESSLLAWCQIVCFPPLCSSSTPSCMWHSPVRTNDALQQVTCCGTGWHAAGANPVLWTQWLILHWCSGWYWPSLPLLSLTSSHKLDNEILERDRPLQVNNKYHIKLLVLHFDYFKVGGDNVRTENYIKSRSHDYQMAHCSSISPPNLPWWMEVIKRIELIAISDIYGSSLSKRNSNYNGSDSKCLEYFYRQ